MDTSRYIDMAIYGYGYRYVTVFTDREKLCPMVSNVRTPTYSDELNFTATLVLKISSDYYRFIFHCQSVLSQAE